VKHHPSVSQETVPPIALAALRQVTKAKTQILMVDDNVSFIELYSQILQDAGYDVLTTGKGRESLQIVRDQGPKVVVLDVVLPDISGIEVCRQIKADPALRDVFVMLISGETKSADQTADGLTLGADEYLLKPIAPKEFLARIHTMVRLMETTVALRASEQHYRRLSEILPSAVFLMDTQFRVTDLNQRAAVMLGYPEPGGLLNKNLFDLIQTSDHNRFRADITALKTGALGNTEYIFLRGDGQAIPVEMSAAISTAPNGESLGLVIVARDVTERKRVEEELRRLPRRITEAQEAERLRVARELHDGVNQVIASATMRLRRVQDILSEQNPAAIEILSRCHKLLVQALEENRRIARNLRPYDLDELGLRAACLNLCKELRSRTGLVVKSQFTRFDRRLPPEVDLSLFRIVQEAFNNVEKHARAKMVRLRISIHQDAVVLKIHDDGRGFDQASTKSAKKGAPRGIGLYSLHERAAALGGTCDVVSNPKQGTAITVRVPIAKVPAAKVK
jgi:two-component system sensor histidine kinase UhpB